jgi:hypothetical protein
VLVVEYLSLVVTIMAVPVVWSMFEFLHCQLQPSHNIACSGGQSVGCPVVGPVICSVLLPKWLSCSPPSCSALLSSSSSAFCPKIIVALLFAVVRPVSSSLVQMFVLLPSYTFVLFRCPDRYVVRPVFCSVVQKVFCCPPKYLSCCCFGCPATSPVKCYLTFYLVAMLPVQLVVLLPLQLVVVLTF